MSLGANNSGAARKKAAFEAAGYFGSRLRPAPKLLPALIVPRITAALDTRLDYKHEQPHCRGRVGKGGADRNAAETSGTVSGSRSKGEPCSREQWDVCTPRVYRKKARRTGEKKRADAARGNSIKRQRLKIMYREEAAIKKANSILRRPDLVPAHAASGKCSIKLSH